MTSFSRITCSTALAAEPVSTWPGVGSVVRDRHRLRIIANHAEGLAEVFTELTQTELTQEVAS